MGCKRQQPTHPHCAGFGQSDESLWGPTRGWLLSVRFHRPVLPRRRHTSILLCTAHHGSRVHRLTEGSRGSQAIELSEARDRAAPID